MIFFLEWPTIQSCFGQLIILYPILKFLVILNHIGKMEVKNKIKIKPHTALNFETARGHEKNIFLYLSIEGFHVTSLQQNLPSHAAHSGHVGSHKIWPNSLLLKLHKA